MDPHSLHFIVDDIIRLPPGENLLQELWGSRVANKRDATYFPSMASLQSDDLSTWEFRAPASPTRTSSSSSETSCSSAAQKIAFLYRAGMKMDVINADSSTHDEDNSTCRPDSIDDTSIIDFAPCSAVMDNEVKVKFRQSHCDALGDIRQEAYNLMNQCGLTEKDVIVCHRPGCRDTLRDVRALVYHLHIHNIHDRSFACLDCEGRYETRRELTMHVCHRRLKSPPRSPIKEGFRRVFTKISSRD